MKWLKKLIDAFLRKVFKFNNNVTFGSFSFEVSKATGGPTFRRCATIHSPTCDFPYTEHNWSMKICAIVVFGLKVVSFTAFNITLSLAEKNLAGK